MKLFFILLFVLYSELSQAYFCTEVYKKGLQILDPYRAYAISEQDGYGVQRIHVIDFYDVSSKIRIQSKDVADIVLQRERFNSPWLGIKDIREAYEIHVPQFPQTTASEFFGKMGGQHRRRIEREMARRNPYSSEKLFPVPRFYEHRPSNGTDLMFRVSLETKDGIVEIVLRKFVNLRTKESEVVGYALHVARYLGIEAHSVYEVLVYGGGFR